MKKLSIALACMLGILLMTAGCCCCCRKQCPPPPCQMKKGECPKKMECPKAKDGKKGPRRQHPGMEKFKKRMDAMKQLREKYPQEMLEIDAAIIAQEDKVDALAAKAGIEMPKRPADMRRLRVAFPKEMQELTAKAPGMKRGEFIQEIKKLQEKLEKK